ncbi:hypothetical protein [Pseudophaeobacter sp.]|uniref:hypothetical protein n=1 Tax=Pseudophaeobacter sp. TaxID=1971739 RepID=UPI0040583B2C
MTRDLIFHIGAHRTGTSAVQQYLHRNIAALKQQGVLYPFKARRHVHLINALFSGRKSPQQLCAELMRRIAAHEMELHTIILSDEDICIRENLSAIGEFRKYFNVKVVFALRRQDLWLESWYLQNIKWQWNPRLSHCTLPEFLAQRQQFHWIDYDRYVRHLEQIFGRENVILNLYEPSQMPPGGAVEMFCTSIDLPPPERFGSGPPVNPSFAPQVSEFMRRLPLDEAPEPYRALLTEACAKIGAAAGQQAPSQLLIPHAQRKRILNGYARGNRALARRYFDREALFLDPLPGVEMPLTEMTLPADSNQLMADFVTPLLRAMIAQHRSEQGGEGAS